MADDPLDLDDETDLELDEEDMEEPQDAVNEGEQHDVEEMETSGEELEDDEIKVDYENVRKEVQYVMIGDGYHTDDEHEYDNYPLNIDEYFKIVGEVRLSKDEIARLPSKAKNVLIISNTTIGCSFKRGNVWTSKDSYRLAAVAIDISKLLEFKDDNNKPLFTNTQVAWITLTIARIHYRFISKESADGALHLLEGTNLEVPLNLLKIISDANPPNCDFHKYAKHGSSYRQTQRIFSKLDKSFGIQADEVFSALVKFHNRICEGKLNYPFSTRSATAAQQLVQWTKNRDERRRKRKEKMKEDQIRQEKHQRRKQLLQRRYRDLGGF